MANYTVLQGQQISDCVENSTGDISNWGLFLTENNFDNWSPNLFSGQILSIPSGANLSAANIQALSEYPANNYSVPDITQQIEAIFEQMNGGMSAFVPNFQPIVADTNVYGVVQNGNGIVDFIMNNTGAIINWDAVLIVNEYDNWTPQLIPASKLAIPASVTMNLNNFRALSIYPANNYSVPDVDEQIIAIFDLMSKPNPSQWILSTGRWNGVATWQQDGLWLTV